MIGIYLFSFFVYISTAMTVTELFHYDDQFKTFYYIFHFPAMYFALALFTFVFAATDKIILVIRRYNKA